MSVQVSLTILGSSHKATRHDEEVVAVGRGTVEVEVAVGVAVRRVSGQVRRSCYLLNIIREGSHARMDGDWLWVSGVAATGAPEAQPTPGHGDATLGHGRGTRSHGNGDETKGPAQRRWVR